MLPDQCEHAKGRAAAIATKVCKRQPFDAACGILRAFRTWSGACSACQRLSAERREMESEHWS